MMTQVQAIGYDNQAIAQANFDRYTQRLGDVVAPLDNSTALCYATQDILHYSFFLANQKKRSKTEYKQLLHNLGWKGEEKRYLKVAAAFEKFSPSELASVEPGTIFRLANNSKKYQPVIDSLADLPQITQAAVRDLIEQQPQHRLPQSENPSIWRRMPNSGRYCQIPPIHEAEEQTGKTLQQMMDSEGLSAQRIVSEAIALRQAFIEGRLVSVESATALPSEVQIEESPDLQYEDLLIEPKDVAMSNGKSKGKAVASVGKPLCSSALPQSFYVLTDAEVKSVFVEELESPEQFENGCVDNMTNEPEPKLDADTVKYDDDAREEIKKLSEAKKVGIIIDFKEISTDMYHRRQRDSRFGEVMTKLGLYHVWLITCNNVCSCALALKYY